MSICLRHFLVALMVASAVPLAVGTQAQPEILHIGSSGGMAGSSTAAKEQAALRTLQNFIREETGFANDIQRQKSWRELATRLAKDELQLGFFQGHEFAWAQAEQSNLKPLAVAVNVYLYPVAYVVARKDDAAKDLAGLKGHSLALPSAAPPPVRLYMERQCQALGTNLHSFFSKVDTPDNIEDAVDDVVDGKMQSAAVDRAGLEGYKHRKPGRFNQLRPVAHSEPFPPPVVAYFEGKLADAVLQRFRHGLLNANKKEKGEMMLTLFHLTRFNAVPADFDKVLSDTRQRFPPRVGEQK